MTTGEGDRPASTPSRRPILLAGAVGVLIGAAVVGGVVLASGGGGGGGGHRPPTSLAQSPSTTSGPLPTIASPSDPGAKQLVQLLAQGATLSFHARYEASSPQYHTALDFWHKGALSRRDTDTTTSAGEIQTSELASPDKDVQCVHSGTVPWTCAPTTLDPNKSPSDLTFGNASHFFQNIALTPSTATLNGGPAECFTAVAGTASAGTGATPNRFCTTPDGIPLLIDTGQGPITLITLDRTPPADSVFTPPAGAVGV